MIIIQGLLEIAKYLGIGVVILFCAGWVIAILFGIRFLIEIYYNKKR